MDRFANHHNRGDSRRLWSAQDKQVEYGEQNKNIINNSRKHQYSRGKKKRCLSRRQKKKGPKRAEKNQEGKDHKCQRREPEERDHGQWVKFCC